MISASEWVPDRPHPGCSTFALASISTRSTLRLSQRSQKITAFTVAFAG
jgi:hypothetical protein